MLFREFLDDPLVLGDELRPLKIFGHGDRVPALRNSRHAVSAHQARC